MPKHPFVLEECRAQNAVFRAVRAGVIARPTRCVDCGRLETGSGLRSLIRLHHASYRPEHHLHVVPLCRSCHIKVHHGSKPDPGLLIVTYPCAGEYDRLEGVAQ